MRYRRLLEQLREHNWTAVGIDLVIVVAGVFIGIQVANWNDDRLTQRRAAGFTERLRSDLAEEAWGYEMQVGYYGDVLRHGRAALAAIAGRVPLTDEALLVAAYRATQYNGNTRRRATYDELTSTGEIGLIGDAELRDLAMRVYTTPMFDEMEHGGRESAYRRWFRLNVADDVQQAVTETCGDHVVQAGNYAGIDGSIDYPCTTGLPADAIAAAAARLRRDPQALRLLRLQVADTETVVFNLTVYYGDLRERLAAVARR